MVEDIERVAWSALLEYGAARMRRAAFKLTHVGEQTGPTPTLVISSCYHVVRMPLFWGLRAKAISYTNDEAPEVLTFSVLPETLLAILEAADRHASAEHDRSRAASLSAMAYIETGERAVGAEVLLAREGGVALHRDLDALLSSDNRTAAAMLARQRGSVYSEKT